MGRQNLEGYDYFARFDPLGGANLGGAINANAAGAAAGSGNIFNVFAIDRADNSVSLRLTAWNGLSARYTHAFGEVAGGGNRGNLDSLGVEYTGTSLEAAAYVYELRAAAGGLQNRGFGLFAAYRVGDVKLLAGHTQNEGHLTGGSKFKDSFVGMKWFVTPVWTVSAQLSSLNIQAIQAKPRVIGASLTCALSKRTQVYVLAARSN